MRVIPPLLAVTTALVLATARPDAQTAGDLRIYTIDVEGGGATLYVPPSGESLLIDTGNGDAAARRDADRIMAAVSDAGLKQIDHLITTHYHGDHVGGVAELASRIPIKHFIDHGTNVEPQGTAAKFVAAYEQLWRNAQHTVAKPGDTIRIAGLDVRVVTSAGKVITSALPGAGQQNPFCAGASPITPDPTENAQSVGISLVFGRFRVAHLGDLTWNGELELMCPTNKFGTADLFIVSHHAQQRPSAMSNSAALVHGLRPRVAISSNGLRKGAQVAAMQVLFSSPGLDDLWQLHASEFSGQEYTVPGAFIANWADDNGAAMTIAPTDPLPQGGTVATHNGAAQYLRVVAQRDGTFSVTNTRNGFSKTYRTAPRQTQ
jgi:beta-lactamase superfamily II metal-dependent hydrolase